MSSGYSSCSNAYMYGTMYAEYSCSFWETSGSASVANNTSKVSWSGKVDYDHSDGYAFSGNTRDEAGYIKVIVNGSVVQTSTVPMDSGMSPGYRLRTFSGTSGAIAHNADGSKSVSCRVEMSSGSDPYGGGFTWSGSTGSTDTVKLTTIARASNPSINTYPSSDNKFTLGDEITIHMNRASSSFTHKVTFYYGQSGKNTRSTVVGTGVTNNVKFNTANIASQFLQDNPNSSSLTGKISVITYNGSTNIGTKEITYTATVPNTYAPTYDASSLVIDETALDPYGIADKVIVRYISKKYITIKVSAKEGATIKSVQLQSGSRTANCTVVDSTNGIWGGTITNMEAGEIKVVVTDSRGKTATYTIPGISIVNYSYPTISKGTLERTNASTGASDARVYGTFWNGSAGTVTNDITMTYRLSNSSTTVDFTNIQKQGNNYDTGEVSVGDLDPQSSFSIYFEGEDSFGQKVSLTVQLPSAHNALWVGKNTVRVHDHLVADGDVAFDGDAGLKSIFDILSEGAGGKNLLQKFFAPGESKSRTLSGLTFVTNYDGSIWTNGTLTADLSLTFQYFMWDRPTTKAIFTCKSTKGDQFEGGTLVKGSATTFFAGLQCVDANGSSNFRTPKNWNGSGTVPWQMFCGDEEQEFLLERHRMYRFFISFKKGTTINGLYFYPMWREAHVVSPAYRQYIPQVKANSYIASGNLRQGAVQIGNFMMVFGTTKAGGTVQFGITFDRVPTLILGRSAIGNNSVGGADPNVRLGSVTQSTFYVDTNYGSTTKYELGWIAIGTYTGHDFWR